MSEILAPAGGIESALTAINAGADALYLGLKSFSARSAAENFDLSSLKQICAHARLFGVKIYVAMNTLVKCDEAEEFFSTAAEVYNAGADAVIIQDALLGKRLKKELPQIPLHLSTQAGICNSDGARFAADCGFDRVILARETPLCDISSITKIIETECFIQGALCTCFSGQCYLSSFIGGNSGNRGKCKQPCRKLYSIDREGFDELSYKLSLSDLSVGKKIFSLREAGVTSFKIEGRMRRPEYVSAAVTYYKKILNGEDEKQAFSDLKRAYNRGNYTSGLAFGQDKNFISSAVQGHIGEYVGVIKVDHGEYLCMTDSAFSAGDGFKVLRGGKEAGGGVFSKSVRGGFILNSRDRLKNGDKVFITTDVKVFERLLSLRRTIPVKISAYFNKGCRPRVVIGDKEYVSGEPLEGAKSRPLNAEDIKSCFYKTDLYPFDVTFGEIETDGVFIPAAKLNAVRRDCYSRFYEGLTRLERRAVFNGLEQPHINLQINKKTAVICADLNGVSADVGILKLPSADADAAALTADFHGEKFLFFPPFLTDGEVLQYAEQLKYFDGLYCDSYYGLKLAQKYNVAFFAGTGMNISNTIALSELGAKYAAISKELTEKESAPLAAGNVFYLSAGNIKVMDIVYCPFGKLCKTCDKRSLYTLTDGDGRKLPMRRYRTSDCRFELYNPANLYTTRRKEGALYDFTLEDAAALSKLSGEELKRALKNVTRGHSANPVL